jgi:quercetin dioxygenase-like cupin family protein
VAIAEQTRTIYHPTQRDSATFIKTSAETGGEYSLLEIELEPGGGNALHRHTAYSERFTVIDGELGVEVEGQTRILRPGDSALVPIGSAHRFFSVEGSRARFNVELRPGHTGMEQTLRIGYGLAVDGQVNAKGHPSSPLHLAVLVELGGMGFVGPMALLAPLFRALAHLARRRGVLQALILRYCPAE